MDQATEQIDAYAEHVKKVRARVEEEETKKAARGVTCNVTMQYDEVEGLLALIEEHYSKYTVTAQALLTRAATRLRDALFID